MYKKKFILGGFQKQSLCIVWSLILLWIIIFGIDFIVSDRWFFIS